MVIFVVVSSSGFIIVASIFVIKNDSLLLAVLISHYVISYFLQVLIFSHNSIIAHNIKSLFPLLDPVAKMISVGLTLIIFITGASAHALFLKQWNHAPTSIYTTALVYVTGFLPSWFAIGYVAKHENKDK
ncbi:hypothetical protein OKN36_14130 [Furfurilactobacillus sp. OKN36]